MAITAKEINLVQLDKELGSKGLIANFEDNKAKLILCVEGSTVSEAQLEAAIAAHIAVDEQAKAANDKAAAQAKLAALGLTADDLKALGIGSN